MLMQSRIFKQMMLLFFVIILFPAVLGAGNPQKRAFPKEKEEVRKVENHLQREHDLIYSIQKMIEICKF